jgi:hypothetical protein
VDVRLELQQLRGREAQIQVRDQPLCKLHSV